MKKVSNLEKKLNKNGYDLILKKYDYWDFIPTAVNRKTGKTTALVWVRFDKDSTTVLSMTDTDTSWNYVKKCLDNNAGYLGILDYRKTGFGCKHRFEIEDLEDFAEY